LYYEIDFLDTDWLEFLLILIIDVFNIGFILFLNGVLNECLGIEIAHDDLFELTEKESTFNQRFTSIHSQITFVLQDS